MKRRVFAAVLFLVLSTLSILSLQREAGSSESSIFSSPILIHNVQELQAIEDNPAAFYELANDIDASETLNWNDGMGFEPIRYLSGGFDGANHKIENLFINRSAEDNVGLFRKIHSGGVINNIILENVNVTGRWKVGAFFGENFGTLKECQVSGKLEATTNVVGGIGGSSHGLVEDCGSSVELKGYTCGGLVASARASDTQAPEAKFVRCFSEGKIFGESGGAAGGGCAGGIAGGIWRCLVERCYSTITILHPEAELGVGGLVGHFYGASRVSDCYATGDVEGRDKVGGLVGVAATGVIERSYSVGRVTGQTNAGGLIGYRDQTGIINSYWDIETSDQTISAGGEGKTTIEMKKEATFVNWDFQLVWDIIEDISYPFLRAGADSFRFPLDEPWTISQRFGRYSYDWNGYHLGEDVLRNFEAPVYAPADGMVKHNAKRTGYGYVMIIEHKLVDETFVCSVLGHLRQEGRASVGSRVAKGHVVGYLSSLPDENGGILHLHYGIRDGAYSEEPDPDGKWRYRGYGSKDIVGYWFPPSAFIEYYNLNREALPSCTLTINTESGAHAAASSTSVCSLRFRTQLTLVATHPLFQRWIETDNDNLNPTTVTMYSDRIVIEWCLSAPPPTPPTAWQLAIDLMKAGADYSSGGQGWSWNPAGGWSWANGKWLSAEEVAAGYYHWDPETGQVTTEPRKGVDCSGLVTWVYNKEATDAGAVTPEALINPLNPVDSFSSDAWFLRKYASSSISKEQLQPGDLLFFDTDDPWQKDPDHVALYVGPFKYKGKTYNVIHASGATMEVSPAWYDSAIEILTTEIPGGQPQSLHVNRGYGRVNVALDDHGQLVCRSPVDLIVTDPDGVILSKDVGEVANMSYTEFDIDGDGDLDDIIDLWEPRLGNYLVDVVPHAGANSTEVFSVEFSASDTVILLADNAQIGEVPADPYVITQNETTTMLRNINVAITDISSPKEVVGQGYSSSINVTAQNQGNLPESLNVTLYANTIVITALSNINLESGDSISIPFTWNTAGFARGNYTIIANVTRVLGETHTADNTKVGDTVLVTIAGDINGDHIVNVRDIQSFGKVYNAGPLDPLWVAETDINDDLIIDAEDLGIIKAHYGQSW